MAFSLHNLLVYINKIRCSNVKCILKSDTAISMNIAIMRAFVAIKSLSLQRTDLKEQLQEIKERLGEHETQLNQIYDAIENLLDEKIVQKKQEERNRIEFKK